MALPASTPARSILVVDDESTIREVIRRYPALGVKDSLENQMFITTYKEIRDAGDSVLALVVFHAHARDGLEIDQPFVHVITFRGSRGIRFEAFAKRELQQALEAAGLSE